MDRRESLKTLIYGGVATSLILNSCITDKETPVVEGDILSKRDNYGRTPEEKDYDEKVYSETFFTEEEMMVISILADIIIPKDEESVSATEADVPDFIEFIVKDIPEHQLPLRGGIMWLNRESTLHFNNSFIDISKEERLKIIEELTKPFEIEGPGQQFFTRIRNLVVTGYFTSEAGFKYLGYQGNTPNLWDGVPDQILERHGLSYDEDLLKIVLDPSTRGEVMNWENYDI